ncbi:ROK family protein [Actinopolymorpha sp. B17G11]|uniref:ROK family transcriptional regulator n=1 Tax=Actinopolymorpha sp. B17G11 TaxID=3160861 RepID=UPI0032E46B7A
MPEPSSSVLRLLRESHEERLLAALRVHGSLSRAELGRRTGLSRATLYAIIQHLIATDRVVELPAVASPSRGRGRPATLVTLNPSGGLALGLDLGHRRIHAAVANVAHEVVGAASERCGERTPWATRLEIALGLVDQLAEEAHISLAALDGVGAGVIGPVSEPADAKHRRSRVELVRDGLADRYGVPVLIDNNTRLAALAESIWGSGAGVPNVLYVRLSYGVGGGLVLGGHLHSGAAGGAGEFGHVSVDPDGPPCHCGGRGCLERYVSIAAILEQCDARRLDHVLDRLRSGDRRTREVITAAGIRLGRVIAAACNVVNPEVVVVGGELAAAGDLLLDPAREALHAYAHRQVRQGLQLHGAELGDEAAARGGIALVLRKSALLAGYPPATAAPATRDADRDGWGTLAVDLHRE